MPFSSHHVKGCAHLVSIDVSLGHMAEVTFVRFLYCTFTVT